MKDAEVDINKLTDEIKKLDLIMVQTFLQRMMVVQSLYNAKKEAGVPIKDFDGKIEYLKNVINFLPKESIAKYSDSILRLFEHILKESNDFQLRLMMNEEDNVF